MYAVIMKHNMYLWPALVNPDKFAYAIPEPDTFGSEDEAVLALESHGTLGPRPCRLSTGFVRSHRRICGREGIYGQKGTTRVPCCSYLQLSAGDCIVV